MRILVVALFLTACGGQPPANSSPSIASSEQAPSHAEPERGSSVVASGVYHLVGPLETVNIDLDIERGRFRWGVTGCDYTWADEGTARVDGDDVVLEKNGLTWFEEPRFRNEVDRITLRRSVDGAMLVARGEIAGERFVQHWDEGGRCLACAALGEPGSLPCDDPYLGE